MTEDEVESVNLYRRKTKGAQCRRRSRKKKKRTRKKELGPEWLSERADLT